MHHRVVEEDLGVSTVLLVLLNLLKEDIVQTTKWSSFGALQAEDNRSENGLSMLNELLAPNVLIMHEMCLIVYRLKRTTGFVCLASRGRTFVPFYSWFLHLALKIVDLHLHVGPNILKI